ncbi:MAG: VWA domain-containing protein [Acidobacteriota bacterium]|nr:MAG: VWA domain-containing protein [Acidobacteriota bacterium]
MKVAKRVTQVIVGMFPALAVLYLMTPVTLPQSQESTERISLVSEAVIIDLVVRDSKGRLVTDLSPGEFRVFENEKEQVVQSVRFIDGSKSGKSSNRGRGRDAAAASGASNPQQSNLISLVFDRLDNESRRFARQTGEDLLKSDLPSNTYIGVFSSEKGLRPLSPFTQDFNRVREAIEVATSGSFDEIAERSRQLYGEVSAEDDESGRSFREKVTAAVQSGSPEQMQTLIERSLLQHLIENSGSVETEFPGLTAVEALDALVSGQKDIRGRKSVVYLSEGMYIPERFSYRFRNTISTANLANVSIYTIDARGLTSQSQSSGGAAALGRAASLSQSQIQGGFATRTADAASGRAASQSGDRGRGPVGPEEMRSLETAEDSIRMNVQETLDDLSRSTGGFLTANTNDTSRAMERISDELRVYYEIAYLPEADYTDAEYRKIRIEVDREGTTVQARDGYYPFPPSADGPAQGYEVPLMAALSRGDLPRDFPLYAKAFRFDEEDGKREEIVAVSVPFDAIQFELDEASQRYKGHFSILALVKDEANETVVKFSREYPLDGPLSELEQLKQGQLLFQRSFEAAPGRYHVEFAAHDHLSRKSSTRRQVLMVTSPRPGIDVSSLVVVGELEELSELERLISSPLKYGDLRIVPHLGPDIPAQEAGEIGVYCRVYADESASETADLTVAVFKNGEALFKGTPELVPQSNPSKLAALFAIPTKDLEPGLYQVKVWAEQGERLAVESTVFSLKQ